MGGHHGDEFAYSDQVARHFSTDHHRIEASSDRLRHGLAGMVSSMSEPMVSPDCLGFFLLADEVSKHVKVVMGGQGADELLAGYRWYPELAGVVREDAAAAYAGSLLDPSHRELAALLQPAWFHEVDEPRRFIDASFARPGASSALDAALRMDTRVTLDDPLKRLDNMMMASGVEARVPFLDHELVELAAAMPPELKLAHGGKGVLKEAARRVLPAAVIDRDKGYFRVPELRHLDAPFAELVRAALTDPAAARRGLFRPEVVSDLLAEPAARQTRGGSTVLWQLGLLEMWLQAHQVG